MGAGPLVLAPATLALQERVRWSVSGTCREVCPIEQPRPAGVPAHRDRGALAAVNCWAIPDIVIHQIATLETAGAGQISFFANQPLPPATGTHSCRRR